ncbi:microsomal glutathione S-transferase 2 [Brienomyrus brachyistius]|uniref:microsomal glutathione S-transferase 2 n=1 Tax=Brienomyrus brachyistius TaxID=42636 RepID=UPI0020B3DC50|nr:microsomal glutathione S-transferase 2 [Brienomyrus brachyistius]XP_048826451.1 microsomal glutathione S-transferase 2 [Brienomyrus brachyistius]
MAADQLLLSAVSLISALQMGYITRCVALSRRKHNVMPPAVTGPVEFERIFRAQQDCVEIYPLFLVVLWISGSFFHEALAALGGLLFIFSRQMYFNGYVNSTKSRLLGFFLSLGALVLLTATGAAALLHRFLDDYLDVNMHKVFKS